MSANDPFIAFSRFGLGARPGDLARLGGDPRAALLAEIADPGTLLMPEAGLPGSADAYARVRDYQTAKRSQRKAADAAASEAGKAAAPAAIEAPAIAMDDNGMDAMAKAPGANKPGKPNKPKGGGDTPLPPNPRSLMDAEIAARIERVLAARIGFGERLVAFWSNHFAVQAASNEAVRGLAGAFEREAIRPYVLGNFGDMVLAATQHPAMLLSLNNATSMGPNSPQGRKTRKGLNENHARELMELHTVGVDGGYTQADVTSFAKVLTGWTFGHGEREAAVYGKFVFRQQAHEPGAQTVLGKRYAQAGVDQGKAVLADLSRSPATARHIAALLAHHFVADAPDPGLVDRLAGVFIKTGGDLKAVTTALLNAPEAWVAPAEKLKTPQEFLWSALRALNLDIKPNFVNRTLADLGQPIWNPPSPQGFKDDTATWLAPDAMTTRVDVAELLVGQDKGSDDPRNLAGDVLGPSLSQATKTAIERAESRNQGLALLLMSPEFQRR